MLLAALGTSHDEGTITQHCGLTPLGCTVQDLVAGSQALGLDAALLPVFGEPGAIAALSNETPFVAMIDLANLSGQGPMFQWHFGVYLQILARRPPVPVPLPFASALSNAEKRQRQRQRHGHGAKKERDTRTLSCLWAWRRTK
jgi:hypothetical protein